MKAWLSKFGFLLTPFPSNFLGGVSSSLNIQLRNNFLSIKYPTTFFPVLSIKQKQSLVLKKLENNASKVFSRRIMLSKNILGVKNLNVLRLSLTAYDQTVISKVLECIHS